MLGAGVFVALFALTLRRGATDPVCGMKVDRAKALTRERDGRDLLLLLGALPALLRMTASLHTFVFADLAGYSALTEAHGDEEAADAAAGFFEIVRSLLAEHGAEEVKVIGDAVLLEGARRLRPPPASRSASCATTAPGTAPSAFGWACTREPRCAAATIGSAVPVNIAARIADMARAGEILCSAATREEGARTGRSPT